MYQREWSALGLSRGLLIVSVLLQIDCATSDSMMAGVRKRLYDDEYVPMHKYNKLKEVYSSPCKSQALCRLHG